MTDEVNTRKQDVRSGVEGIVQRNIIANQLRWAMQVHNVDPYILIELTGLSRNTVMDAIEGVRLLTKASVLRICAALRISEQWLKTANSGLDAEGAPRPMNKGEWVEHRKQMVAYRMGQSSMALRHNEVPTDLQTVHIPSTPQRVAPPGVGKPGRRYDSEERIEQKRLLSQRMRLILKARKIGQADFPGVSAQAIWNICQGNSWPTYHTFVKLGQRLRLTIGQLKGEEPMTAADFIGGVQQMNEQLAEAIMKEKRIELDAEMKGTKENIESQVAKYIADQKGESGSQS